MEKDGVILIYGRRHCVACSLASEKGQFRMQCSTGGQVAEEKTRERRDGWERKARRKKERTKDGVVIELCVPI